MKKCFAVILLSLLIGIVKASPVSASFGISPADITIEHLRPGGHYEKKFLLSRTDTGLPLQIIVEPEIEGANSWISVEPGFSFTMNVGEKTKEMKIIIDVPKNAPYQAYKGYVTVKTGKKTASQGVSVVRGVSIATNLITTTLTVNKLIIREIKIPAFQQGNLLKAIIKTENQGNVDGNLDKAVVTVKTLSGEIVETLTDDSLEKVAPSQTKEIVAEFGNSLQAGEYSGEAVVFYKDLPLREEIVVFQVLEADKRDSVDSGLRLPVSLPVTVGIAIAAVSTVVAVSYAAVSVSAATSTSPAIFQWIKALLGKLKGIIKKSL